MRGTYITIKSKICYERKQQQLVTVYLKYMIQDYKKNWCRAHSLNFSLKSVPIICAKYWFKTCSKCMMTFHVFL